MTEFGYHASHEQLGPAELLELVRDADRAGFDAVLSSDHLAPWSVCQGHAGNSHVWLGAAVTSTRCPFGTVTAPGYRYNPVVLAQAFATIATLAPGRFIPALGSGQALNEHVTGEPWPDKAARNARLAECAAVIRRLLAGEEVEHAGLVRVHRARIFERAPAPVPLFGAALSPESAHSVGQWADGLVTVAAPPARLRAIIEAFRGEQADGRPVHAQIHVSWAPTDEESERQAVQRWPVNALPADLTEELETPEEFDERYRGLGPADLGDSVVMSADPERHRAALQSLVDAGVERIYVHDVGADQQRFIAEYQRQVIQPLR